MIGWLGYGGVCLVLGGVIVFYAGWTGMAWAVGAYAVCGAIEVARKGMT